MINIDQVLSINTNICTTNNSDNDNTILTATFKLKYCD